jgi:hypothetical protein
VSAFLATLAMLWMRPGFVFSHDRRECDGERYVEVCAGLRLRPETWACAEFAR